MDLANLSSTLDEFVEKSNGLWQKSAFGVTRAERQIFVILDHQAYSQNKLKHKILLVSGLTGSSGDVGLTFDALDRFRSLDPELIDDISLSAIPCVNPGGLTLNSSPSNGSGGFANTGYPPKSGFFDDKYSPESRYLWRFTCYLAPDIVIELVEGSKVEWKGNIIGLELLPSLVKNRVKEQDSFVASLGEITPESPGTIPALRLTTSKEMLNSALSDLFSIIRKNDPIPSSASKNLDKRSSRSILQVGKDLSKTNGRTLNPLIYTQGVAVSGRLRLAEIDSSILREIEDIKSLVTPVLESPIEMLGSCPEAPELAAVVWTEEMKSLYGDSEYDELAVIAANYINQKGKCIPPGPLNPNYIVEDFFFASAVLGRAYQATQDIKYIDILVQFLLDSNIQEPSGLFPHSRYGKLHWGRGNGFAAMGLAETLTYIPDIHPKRGLIKEMATRQLESLKYFQKPSGMYSQVIDFEGSYEELTATCMIGYSAARGINRRWLDRSFDSLVERAWYAVSRRIDFNGNVVDGCTGTGVMDNLRSYLDRPANSGHDDRTGSLALWFTSEMAYFSK